MTFQEFNHLYYKFTKDKKGVKPYSQLSVSGEELKKFLEFSMEYFSRYNNQTPDFET